MSVANASNSGFLPALTGALRFLGFVLLCLIFLIPQLIAGKYNRKKLPRISRMFYRGLVRDFGLTVRAHGAPTKDSPALFVANHTSYLDVLVLGSLIEGNFVAKSEVADWPVIGMLTKIHQTAFVERRSIRAADQRDKLQKRLAQGDNLILFPEGTSSDGQRTLPFKSSLFSLVEINGANGRPITVQPVTVVCTGLGGLPISKTQRPLYAWFGDMTLGPHLCNMFKYGRFTVDVIFHEPTSIDKFRDRKELSAHCQKVIAKGVEQLIAGRPLP